MIEEFTDEAGKKHVTRVDSKLLNAFPAPPGLIAIFKKKEDQKEVVVDRVGVLGLFEVTRHERTDDERGWRKVEDTPMRFIDGVDFENGGLSMAFTETYGYVGLLWVKAGEHIADALSNSEYKQYTWTGEVY